MAKEKFFFFFKYMYLYIYIHTVSIFRWVCVCVCDGRKRKGANWNEAESLVKTFIQRYKSTRYAVLSIHFSSHLLNVVYTTHTNTPILIHNKFICSMFEIFVIAYTLFHCDWYQAHWKSAHVYKWHFKMLELFNRLHLEFFTFFIEVRE